MAGHHEKLRRLSGEQFEQFVADLWRVRGWNASVTQTSGDRGVDVVAERDGPLQERQAIQAKCYGPNTSVGSPEVQQYSSLRRQEDADAVVVVTTGPVTAPAEELASELNVKLLDGDGLNAMISETGASDLVSEYVDQEPQTADTSSSTTTSGDDTENSTATGDSDEKMDLNEAVVAVVQLLLVVGVVGYGVFVLLF